MRNLEMETINIYFVIFAFLLFIICEGYNYDSNGADWTGTCSSGAKQSPINFIPSSATVNKSLGSFTFTNYDQTNQYSVIKNNGHTIQVDIANSNVKVSGGGLVPDDYILAQFHIHFSNISSEGSEHTINGNQYPLEIHFVHYGNSHGDISTAAAATDGLAVLGFLFEIQSSDNAALNFFLQEISSVPNKDDSTSLNGPAINSLFTGISLTKYYRYSGSLTTPTCGEVVQWTVFDDKIKISETQMNLIRATYLDNGTTLIGKNYRMVQDLGARTVHVSFENSAILISPSFTILTVVTLYCLNFFVIERNM